MPFNLSLVMHKARRVIKNSTSRDLGTERERGPKEKRESFKHFRPPWWKEMEGMRSRKWSGADSRQKGRVVSLTRPYILCSQSRWKSGISYL